MRRIVEEQSILPVLLREKALMLRAKRMAMQTKSTLHRLMDGSKEPPRADDDPRRQK